MSVFLDQQEGKEAAMAWLVHARNAYLVVLISVISTSSDDNDNR